MIIKADVKTPHVLRVRKLEKLCDTAFNDFLEGKFETLFEYEQEKKKVVETIISEDGASIVNDSKALAFSRLIHPKDRSKCGKLLNIILGDAADQYALFNEEDLDKFASDWFYSWTCGTDYVEKLLEIGKILLKRDVPSNLHRYVEEARICFAIERYLAVCALSRTIIETFLLHLCELIEEEPEKDKEHGNPIMGSVFKIVSKGDKSYKNRLHKLHYRTSRRIHGDKLVNKEKAKEIFQETINLVQDIYDLHEAAIQSKLKP